MLRLTHDKILQRLRSIRFDAKETKQKRRIERARYEEDYKAMMKKKI